MLPRWSRDGRELFYRLHLTEGRITNIGTWANAQSVEVGARDDTFLHEPPQPLVRFQHLNLEHSGGDYSTYAVGPEGTLLIPVRIREDTTAGAPSGATPDQNDGITLLRNWEAALIRNR
jgi:hypothetical protein